MLNDLDIKYRYSTGGKDSPIRFFTETLSNSIKFDLGLGFFSSASINVLSTGFARFISNGGKMRMYINQSLSEEDYNAISSLPVEQLEDKLIADFSAMVALLSKRDKHFFNCLSFLIYKNRIEIKIVVPKTGGIAHQKFGILTDENNNKVCFTGSLNFTANALLRNIETIDCYNSWEDGNVGRIAQSEEDFESIFNEYSDSVIIYEPRAFEKIIKTRFSCTEVDKLLKEEQLLIEELSSLSASLFTPYETAIDNEKAHFPYATGPFQYQIDAYYKWVNNNFQGIFAMATGTGKTITSLNCVLEEYKKTGKYAVLILVPSIDLLQQWTVETGKFNFTNVFIVSCQSDWRSQLSSLKNDLDWGIETNYVIISTYNSFINEKFQNILRALSSEDMILIADEAHNIGAQSIRDSFASLTIKKRIALSATPRREYDIEGTTAIESFFSDHYPYCCSYSMEDAIKNGSLMEYLYYPRLVYLNDEEMDKYLKFTLSLLLYYNKSNKDSLVQTPEVKTLLMKRKRVLHKASDKSRVFMNIVHELYHNNKAKYCFVYAPEGKDYRMSDDERILINYKSLVNDVYPQISTNTYLGGEPYKQDKLKSFAEGKIDMLFAMKCLDEGVDVPRAEVGIFTSSTGNPRQFIQRRGRLLRVHPDKRFARIYDMIVVPDFKRFPNKDTYELERRLVKNELIRVSYFASLASNYNLARTEIADLLDYYNFEISTLIQELQKQ